MDRCLYDERGRRKYLVPAECKAFISAARQQKGETATFCSVLAITGARISEVLALTPERIDDSTSTITFCTLKQRGRTRNRAVHVPRSLLNFLNTVHRYRDLQRDLDNSRKPLWVWSRTTAWRKVKVVMQQASIPPFVATPRAVRHAFGANAVMKGVNLTMIQRWLGHSRIETTTVYTTVVGSEERALARKMFASLW